MARAKLYFERMEAELADPDMLPKRRGQVMECAAAGMQSKEIARALGISVDTVNWHLAELMDQFHAASRLDLVSQGWMHGILKARKATVLPPSCWPCSPAFPWLGQGYPVYPVRAPSPA